MTERLSTHTHPLKAANHYQFTNRIMIINSIGKFLAQIFPDRLLCVSPVPGPGDTAVIETETVLSPRSMHSSEGNRLTRNK